MQPLRARRRRCASPLPARRSSPRAALAALHARRLRGRAGADPARPPGRPRHEAARLAGQGSSRSSTAWPSRSRAACAWTASSADDAQAAREALLAAAPDVMVVAAYGLILPPWVLDAAAPGLPQHPRLAAAALARRGADPARDRGRRRATGITIMQMDAGLDTGDMLLVESRRADRAPTTAPARCTRAWRRSAAADRRGARRDAARGAPAAAPQPEAGVTYAAQDHEGRGADRLARAGGSDRAPPARLRPVSRRAHFDSAARRSSSGARGCAPASRPRPVRSSTGRTPCAWPVAMATRAGPARVAAARRAPTAGGGVHRRALSRPPRRRRPRQRPRRRTRSLVHAACRIAGDPDAALRHRDTFIDEGGSNHDPPRNASCNCRVSPMTAAAMAPALAATAGSGNAVTEPRAVSGFQTIALRGAIDWSCARATAKACRCAQTTTSRRWCRPWSMAVATRERCASNSSAGESVRAKTPVVVTVDVVELSAVASSGSGDIRIEALNTPALSLGIAGSSNARLSSSTASSSASASPAAATCRRAAARPGSTCRSPAVATCKLASCAAGDVRRRFQAAATPV